MSFKSIYYFVCDLCVCVKCDSCKFHQIRNKFLDCGAVVIVVICCKNFVKNFALC